MFQVKVSSCTRLKQKAISFYYLYHKPAISVYIIVLLQLVITAMAPYDLTHVGRNGHI